MMGGGIKLFDFSVKQKTYEINGTVIGGEPGLTPTVMVGSMFYKGDKTVEDRAKGLFNKDEAESRLRKAEEMSDLTGLPTMVDLIAENAVAAARYLDFMVEATDMPIFLDIVSEDGLTESLQYTSDHGMMERIILNSLNPHSGEHVYTKIKETRCTSSVLLLHSAEHMLTSNKDALIEEMVPKAEAAGIKNILMDTAVIDIPTLGLATKAIHRIKDKYGYPCGCGAHNAIASWKRLKKKYSKDAVTVAIGVVNALPTAVGADFVIYGPLKNAETIYPAVAMIDTAYSQQMIERKIRPSRDHPRFRIG
jgi:tetrahydromethanopterin S-methyltransferase subunit H